MRSSPQTTDRAARFRAEAAELNVKVGNPGRENAFQRLGALAMAAGIAVAFGAFAGSRTLSDARDVQTQTTLAVAGMALTIGGGIVFLRYSLGRFLRLWLLRQIHESRAQLDEALHTAPPADAFGAPTNDPPEAVSPDRGRPDLGHPLGGDRRRPVGPGSERPTGDGRQHEWR
jgi:hypothetical protein